MKRIQICPVFGRGLLVGLFGSGLALLILHVFLVVSVNRSLEVVLNDPTKDLQQIVYGLRSALGFNPLFQISTVVLCSADHEVLLASDEVKVETDICRRKVLSLRPRTEQLIGIFDPPILAVTEVQDSSAAKWGLGGFVLLAALFALIWRLSRWLSDLRMHRVRSDLAADIAAQFAHDVRSPLSILNVVVGRQNSVSPDVRDAILRAIGGINSIAEDLLKRNRDQKNDESAKNLLKASTAKMEISNAYPMQGLGEELNLLKRLFEESQNVRFSCEVVGDLSSAQSRLALPTLVRCLHILINNAHESITQGGFVSVLVEIESHKLQIVIRDSGKGIDESILAKLGKERITYGKPQGNGRGVKYVFEEFGRVGGEVLIQSEVGRGTTISLSLPLI